MEKECKMDKEKIIKALKSGKIEGPKCPMCGKDIEKNKSSIYKPIRMTHAK